MKTMPLRTSRFSAFSWLAKASAAGIFLGLGFTLRAQNPLPDARQAQSAPQPMLNEAELKQLVAPIALYPDALIALILPASTVPSDVVLGARYLDVKADPAQASREPWDDSVKSLVYYPEVLNWMNENLEWTASLGEAFVTQPADVMNVIQGLRAKALASGALKDSPEQKVVVQEQAVRIVPANPEVIYVPQYNPAVVFADDYSGWATYGYDDYGYGYGDYGYGIGGYGLGYGYGGYGGIGFGWGGGGIAFGIGFGVGPWLNYDCDWGRRNVCRGDWNGWNGGNNFINNTIINNTNVNVVNINSNTARVWSPSNRSLRQLAQRQRNGGGNARFTSVQARSLRERVRSERNGNNGRLSRETLAGARRNGIPSPRNLHLGTDNESVGSRGKAREIMNRQNRAPLDSANLKRENREPANREVARGFESLRRIPTAAPRVKGQLDDGRLARTSSVRQNVRQNADSRTAQRPDRTRSVPTTRADAFAPPSNRPSISPRGDNDRSASQNVRSTRPEGGPQRRQMSQPRQERRQETRSQPTRSVERRSAERPRQEQRQVVRQRSSQPRPQRQEIRPQRQENRSGIRSQQRQQRSENRSSQKDERKKRT